MSWPKNWTEKRWIRSQLRFTELPYHRYWGFVVRVVKTFEVYIFKLLEILDLYRPKKWIVGIPSLATRRNTFIQAIIYNGTKEAVLGFHPKRITHRILKGLPDLESFEKLRFQISEGDTVRTVEASTETRGFVSLQMPWPNILMSKQPTWTRIEPLGIETFITTVPLGDYEVLSAPIFSLSTEYKNIIVSDIDDTIKDSKIGQTTTFKELLRGLFKGNYYRYESIGGMPELYRELAKDSLIIYVTSTPFPLAPFLLKFLRDSGFPEGPVFMRWLGYNRFGHKLRAIRKILNGVENQKVIFIGDSGEEDLEIYRYVCENPEFEKKVKNIFIRHLPGTPLKKTVHPREVYYKEISELKSKLQE